MISSGGLDFFLDRPICSSQVNRRRQFVKALCVITQLKFVWMCLEVCQRLCLCFSNETIHPSSPPRLLFENTLLSLLYTVKSKQRRNVCVVESHERSSHTKLKRPNRFSGSVAFPFQLLVSETCSLDVCPSPRNWRAWK